MNPIKIVELLRVIFEAVKEYVRRKRVGDLKDAKNTSLDERDQRPLENALGGSSGPASDSKYPGMYTRTREDKK